MNLMKIFYVITQSESIGGASLHLLDLAEAMQLKGHQVIIAAGGQGKFAELAKARSLQYVQLKYIKREISPFNDLKSIFELRKKIKEYQPDVVHCHSSKAGIVGRLAAFFAKTPSIFTAHGWAFTEGVSKRKRAFYTLIERAISPITKKIITVSIFDRELALKCKVSNPNRLVAIQNGIVDIAYTEKTITNNPIRLVMVARFDEQKNQTALLYALEKIKSLDFVVDFVGDGNTLNECSSLTQKLGIQEHVVFHGHLDADQVSGILKNADIFLLITNWEGFPLSILEGMRQGLPIIATNVGGISEQVDNENGILLKNNNIDEIASALTKLITNPLLCKKLGKNGREKFENNFLIEDMIEKTESVYLSILDKKS